MPNARSRSVGALALVLVAAACGSSSSHADLRRSMPSRRPPGDRRADLDFGPRGHDHDPPLHPPLPRPPRRRPRPFPRLPHRPPPRPSPTHRRRPSPSPRRARSECAGRHARRAPARRAPARHDHRRPQALRNTAEAYAAGYRSIGDAADRRRALHELVVRQRRPHPRPDATRVGRVRVPRRQADRGRRDVRAAVREHVRQTCPTSAARSRSGTCTATSASPPTRSTESSSGHRRSTVRARRERRRPATRRCCTCGPSRTRAVRSPRSRASAPGRFPTGQTRNCDTRNASVP